MNELSKKKKKYFKIIEERRKYLGIIMAVSATKYLITTRCPDLASSSIV